MLIEKKPLRLGWGLVMVMVTKYCGSQNHIKKIPPSLPVFPVTRLLEKMSKFRTFNEILEKKSKIYQEWH